MKMSHMRKAFAFTLLFSAAISAKAVAREQTLSVRAIPDAVWSRMQGRSWRSDLPCPTRDQLALLAVPYWDFDGRPQRGQLIVARSVAHDVARAFEEIYRSERFRIARMRLIDDYEGSDDASMDDNNTSAFNCRTVAGTNRLSKHAMGLAVDINPIQNPYREGPKTSPRAGRMYDEPHERMASVVGLIRKGDVVTNAFSRIGWTWGGDFRHTKDYQHFAR